MMQTQHCKPDDLFKQVTENDDEEAFRTLFFQFYQPLCVFACRYIPDSDMVCEDIVQESFARIWERRKSILVASSFRNFIVTMVRNACVDHLRRQQLEHGWQQWRLHTDMDDTTGEIYSVDELRQLLDNALDKLPVGVRTSFVMNRFERKKYAEIAQTQNISIKTVEAHISKALRLLRAELKDYLPLVLWLSSLN